MEDKRFAHIKTDPKFRRIPKSESKVKIDRRFQSMFQDKQFKVKYTVDKRGRPVNQTSKEDLKRYYELTSESESEEEEQSDLVVKDKSDKTVSEDIKKKLKDLKVDYARGESKLLPDSSSDDEESDGDVSETDDLEHKWGELDNDAESTEEMTNRLAACNTDWDRIRAVDLLVLFNSFLPPGGIIKSVAIYPSEYGKERMKEEDVKGPTELVQGNEEEDDETEEGAKYHMEKLRKYQLNRLKYYYAVITFDSPNSANKIYTECDGMEYESSATKIDLRFIPDDMTFDDEAKEMCHKLPEVNKYQPRFFTTTALQQAKVNLTWDETAPERIEFSEKLNTGKLDDLTQHELGNFVALSSDESGSEAEEITEENGKNPIDKYKLLLQEIEEKESKKKQSELEMEVTWGIDLKEKTEALVKKKLNENEDKTPFEKYLDKRKEKRKEKRKAKKNDEQDEDSDMPSDIDMNDPYFAEELNNPEFKKPKKSKQGQEKLEDEDKQAELELLVMNEEDDKSHFSLKKIQEREKDGKKKNKKQLKNEESSDNFEVNASDDRFSALYTSHLFNIDPTDPHFKKTKGMEKLINEKIKRRIDEDEPQVKKVKKEAELSVLVKSVKRKTEAIRNKRK